jgi:hypothetical protein
MRRISIVACIALLLAAPVISCENALSELVGFTVIAATEVDKDQLHELSDGKRAVVTLRNGMAVRFDKPPRDTWGVAGLRTSVFVFARSLSEGELEWHKKMGIRPPSGEIYMLLIDDSTYEVKRVS